MWIQQLQQPLAAETAMHPAAHKFAVILQSNYFLMFCPEKPKH